MIDEAAILPVSMVVHSIAFINFCKSKNES